MSKQNFGNLDKLFDEVTIIRNKNAKKEAEKKALRAGKSEIKERQGNCEIKHKNKRLDDSTEAEKHNRVTREQGLMIQNARKAKNWKQKDLANQIRVKQDIIAQYENGKAIIDNKIICLLERKLNIRLRNKK